MFKRVLLSMLFCLSVTGCNEVTAPKTIYVKYPIQSGIVVNGSDSSVVVVINRTTIAMSLAPGESRPVDIGPGSSAFYAAWSQPNDFKRAFNREVRGNDLVSVDQYQNYHWVWIIGKGFYTHDNTTIDPDVY